MFCSKAVGKRIQELLFEKQMTQYRLAKITCLNDKTLSDLIKGKTRDVKLSTIILVSSALGVSLEEFFRSPLFKEDNLDV